MVKTHAATCGCPQCLGEVRAVASGLLQFHPVLRAHAIALQGFDRKADGMALQQGGKGLELVT